MHGVIALVVDLTVNENRRKAAVKASEGHVLDWLLKSMGNVDSKANLAIQAEASQALAHLPSNGNTCKVGLSRPHALPYLFQLISFLHVK